MTERYLSHPSAAEGCSPAEGRRPAEGGFTLVELLVGVALGALLLTALYATFFGVMRAGSSAEGQLDRRIEAGRFLDAISRDIHSAYFEPGSAVTAFSGARTGMNSTLTMSAFSRAFFVDGAPATDLRTVLYSVDETPGGASLVRDAWNPYTAEKTRVVLVEGVDGFEVSFYDSGRWTKAWEASLEARLPEAVRVTVRLDEGESFTSLARTMIRQ